MIASHAGCTESPVNTVNTLPSFAAGRDRVDAQRAMSAASEEDTAVRYASVQFTTVDEDVTTPPLDDSAQLMPFTSSTRTSAMYM